MQTRLIFSDSSKNLDMAKKQLTKRYKDLDELFQNVQREHCSDPEKVNDYMLWHTINLVEKDQASKSMDEISRPELNLVFKEEIILQTYDFYSVLTPRRMELLEYIHEHNPSSMKTLAEETGRDYKNVYDDVLALQRVFLLELIREGKNKRPVSRLSAIEILFKK